MHIQRPVDLRGFRMFGSAPQYLFCGSAIVILHGTLHRSFMYNVDNTQMVQSGDEIIYFFKVS